MRHHLYYFLIITSLGLASMSCGQQKTTATQKSNSAYGRILQAESQRTVPGREEGEIRTDYYIALLWTSKESPVTMFWKNGDAWLPCEISRMTRAGVPADRNPRRIEISAEQVKQGDSLMLRPVSGGKFPIPDEINQSVKQAIFFKTSTSAWMHLPVDKISRRPDIIMP